MARTKVVTESQYRILMALENHGGVVVYDEESGRWVVESIRRCGTIQVESLIKNGLLDVREPNEERTTRHAVISEKGRTTLEQNGRIPDDAG